MAFPRPVQWGCVGRCGAALAAILAGMGIAAGVADRTAGPDGLRPTPWDAAIREVCRRHMPPGWDWRILKAMVYRESRFDPGARSPSGAAGLCQITPAAARALGCPVESLRQPEANLEAGARLLRRCWEAAEGLPDDPPQRSRSRAAVAAYAAGRGALDRARAACGPAGRSWRALSAGLPAPARAHADAVFERVYPRVRRVHPAPCLRNRGRPV